MKPRFFSSLIFWAFGVALLIVLTLGGVFYRKGGEQRISPPKTASPLSSEPSVPVPSTTTADLAGSVRETLALPPSRNRDQKLAALLSDWLRRNPQGVRAFLDSLGMDDDELGGQFFAVLPDVLPYLSEQAASSPYLAELVMQMLKASVADDPHQALHWAEAWLPDDSLDQARVIIAGELAKTAPPEALAQLDKIQNPLRRIEALSVIGEGYAENDPKEAIGWAASLPHDAEVVSAMNSVLAVMAVNDPVGAAQAFRTVQSHVAENYHRLVVQDRKRRGLPETPQLDEQGNEIVQDAGGEDVMPSENPDFNLMADASETIAHVLAGSDPAAALEWANSLPGILKTDSRRAALSAWAETDAPQAYRYIQASGVNDAETYGALFSAWSESDPQAAGRAALTVENSSLRQQAIAGVVSNWADTAAPADITQWIDHLPNEKDRNVANRALAEEASGDRPQEAWGRAVLISNPDERREVLATTFASLVASEPSRAAAALSQASNLTSREKEELSSLLTGSAAR